MNMQAIQIMILLLDSFIKLAPWRIVTEAMDRIGCSASESLARSLVVIAAACAGLCALPMASIFGPLLLIGYVGAAISLHIRTGSPLFGQILFGSCLGMMVWTGLWLRDRKLRTLLQLSGRFAR
jgi:DoxX-like family